MWKLERSAGVVAEKDGPDAVEQCALGYLHATCVMRKRESIICID